MLVMLLGRPFLKTARTQINYDTGKLTCQFAGKTVTFDIFKVERHPHDTEMVDYVDAVDSVVEETMPKIESSDMLDTVIQRSILDEEECLKEVNQLKAEAEHM